MWKWWKGIVSGEVPLDINAPVPLLMERALADRKAHLSSTGALTITTGQYTGRAANDKYVVLDDFSLDVIDWENNILKMDYEIFQKLKEIFLQTINVLKPHTYIMERSVSADPATSLGIRLITPSAAHALFCHHIFRAPAEQHTLGDFTIYHCPEMDLPYKDLNLHSSTVIAISFETREIIISGTGYCGEIKKSVFSVLNTILPEYGVLPLHSGANCDKSENVSLFFGLSGTGKTTLSTDLGMKLIGDDEIGLSPSGVFNFEGGCYAKTFNLNPKSEPQIYQAISHFGTLLENVTLDHHTREPLMDDKSITENGRATYPLSFLDNIVTSGRAQLPSHIFFLSADALGVLPAVSKLTLEQAIFYFLSGYTAKVAGTEIGSEEIKTTFSHCFGAPFMMRRAEDYGQLLKQYLQHNQIDVWLINTGWFGGSYGTGERYPLSFTRQCIRAIQNGEGDHAEYEVDPVFSLSMPKRLGQLKEAFFNPKTLWDNEQAYLAVAKELKDKLQENFLKYNDVDLFQRKLSPLPTQLPLSH